MVRYRWERVRGRRVYAEIPPDTCPNGHTRLGAAWGQCPGCGQMGRLWRCQECDAVLFDYDHECGTAQQPDRPVL